MFKNNYIIYFCLLFVLGCDYTPIHLNKGLDYNIKILEINGDNEINNYLVSALKRNSKNFGKEIQIRIKTTSSKKIIAKNTKSLATDYKLNTVVNFELIFEDDIKKITFKESFTYKNLNNTYEQGSYEKTIKQNFARSIVSKLNLRIQNL